MVWSLTRTVFMFKRALILQISIYIEIFCVNIDKIIKTKWQKLSWPIYCSTKLINELYYCKSYLCIFYSIITSSPIHSAVNIAKFIPIIISTRFWLKFVIYNNNHKALRSLILFRSTLSLLIVACSHYCFSDGWRIMQ